ncbi:MAG: DUF1778 domain-containing protein [Capsulimonas sp.]|uniref:type II toxin -antitoxin system TacA 1-like antitoxin n=1 Tax=Capsulimonas sp. TaxID=2494211 RepID=UPI003266438A
MTYSSNKRVPGARPGKEFTIRIGESTTLFVENPVDEFVENSVDEFDEEPAAKPGKNHGKRISISMLAGHKTTIEFAARLKGLSINDYIRSTMIEQARADIQRVKEAMLTEEDVKQILHSSSPSSHPSESLREVSEQYVKMISEQS